MNTRKIAMKVLGDDWGEGLQPEDLKEDLETIQEVHPDAELTMEDEYLTLWIDGEIITQGESEVETRLKQIIRENNLQW